LGVNPAWIGAVLLLNRVTEAIVEPWIGYKIDRQRREGKNYKPLVLVGGIVAAVCLPLLFTVAQHWGPSAKLFYLLFGTTFYYIGLSCFTIALNSLVIDRTSAGSDRNRLAAWFTSGILLSGFPSNWLLPFVLSDLSPTGGQDRLLRCTVTGSIVMLAGACVIYRGCRELKRPPNLISRPPTKTRERSSIYGGVLASLRVHPFLVHVLVNGIAV